MNYENKETTTDTSASERQPSAAGIPATYLSLCSGYDGIGIALQRIYGGALRTLAHVEIESFAIANLVAKMEAGQLDSCPVYTDVKRFPFEDLRGRVGILSAGFPCQPFSSAGKRQATDDPRHIYPYIADGISVCRPSYVLLENVEGIISAKTGDGESVLKHVLGDLEERGYTCSWGTFSAAEISGCDGRRIPHLRKRVFILAKLADGNGEGLEGRQRGSVQERTRQLLVGESGSQALYPARPNERQREWEEPRVVGELADSRHAESSGRNEASEGCVQEPLGESSPQDSGDGELADSNSGRQPPRIESRSGEKADSRRQENSIEGYGVEELADAKSGKPRKSQGRDRRKDTGGGSEEVGQLGDTSKQGLEGVETDVGRGRKQQVADDGGEVRKRPESTGGQLADAQHSERRTDEGLSARNERREGTSGDAEGCLQADLPETESELGRAVDAWGGLRGVDPTANRVDRLRLLGNGVCVDTCVLAFTTLYNRLNNGDTNQ